MLIVDLAAGSFDGVALVEGLRAAGELGSTRTLGVYSHVDVATRQRADAAGFDLIVPRSRMAREGAAAGRSGWSADGHWSRFRHHVLS